MIDPYRSLSVIQTKKILCMNCSFFWQDHVMLKRPTDNQIKQGFIQVCMKSPYIIKGSGHSPITGRFNKGHWVEWIMPNDKNKNFNCSDYEEIPKPPPSLWRKFWSWFGL